MQIIPTKNNSLGLLAFDFYTPPSLAGKGSELFADLLKAGSSSLDTAALQPHVATGRPVSDPPVISRQDSGVSETKSATPGQDTQAMKPTDPARDVKITREEYPAVREKLEKSGVSEEKLAELDKKAASPEGLTWGQLAQAVHQDVSGRHFKVRELTEADKGEITSFLTKAGFTPDESAKLIQAMQSGQGDKALKAISAKLAAMDPSQTLTLNQSEMAALTKAMNLSDGSSDKLLAAFGGKESLELTGKGAAQAIGAMGKELADALKKSKDDLKEIKESLDPLKEKALARLDVIRDANDAKVDVTHTKPTEMMRAPGEDAAKGENKQQANSQGNSQGNGHDDPRQARQDGSAKRDNLSQQDQAAGKQAQEGKAADKAVSDFTSKIRVEGNATSTDAKFAAAVQNMAAKADMSASGLASGQASRMQDARVLNQVESGILRNLGQGMKQLTLELTPETMGKLNVVLTMKGNEVQALIKADNPQAERVIAENLQQIKQSLENQGLTVSKLEVRTGLAQDGMANQQQWSGADKHNLSQERRETQDRMRTNALLAGDAGSLARSMQNEGATVKISQGGLSVIA